MPIHEPSDNAPPEPVGDDEAATWFKWVHRTLTKRLRFISTPQIRFNYTTQGILPEINLKTPPGTQVQKGGTNKFYRGEWDSATQYVFQEVVTRGALGEFICLTATSLDNLPEAGAPYWHGWSYPSPGTWA